MAIVSDDLVLRGSRSVPRQASATGLTARVRSAATTGAIALRAVSSAAFCVSSTTSLDDAGVLRTAVAQTTREER